MTIESPARLASPTAMNSTSHFTDIPLKAFFSIQFGRAFFRFISSLGAFSQASMENPMQVAAHHPTCSWLLRRRLGKSGSDPTTEIAARVHSRGVRSSDLLRSKYGGIPDSTRQPA
jgi:hypothetical protein